MIPTLNLEDIQKQKLARRWRCYVSFWHLPIPHQTWLPQEAPRDILGSQDGENSLAEWTWNKGERTAAPSSAADRNSTTGPFPRQEGGPRIARNQLRLLRTLANIWKKNETKAKAMNTMPKLSRNFPRWGEHNEIEVGSTHRRTRYFSLRRINSSTPSSTGLNQNFDNVYNIISKYKCALFHAPTTSYVQSYHNLHWLN